MNNWALDNAELSKYGLPLRKRSFLLDLTPIEMGRGQMLKSKNKRVASIECVLIHFEVPGQTGKNKQHRRRKVLNIGGGGLGLEY